MSQSTLYDRLGGAYPIAAVVDYFSDQLLEKETIKRDNPQIEEWNAEKAPERLPGLKFLRTLWVCAIAGGPFEYTGLPLRDAHYKLHIAPEEFDDVAAVLADALDHFGVPKREKEEVLAAFAAHKQEVTAGAVAEPSAV